MSVTARRRDIRRLREPTLGLFSLNRGLSVILGLSLSLSVNLGFDGPASEFSGAVEVSVP